MTPRAMVQVLFAAVLTGWLAWPSGTLAQSLADYTAMPPNAGLTVKPNILLVMDNTASMRERAACGATCFNFSSATKYSGMFESLTCYTYDTADGRFEPAATKAAFGSTCASTAHWDGNFLNWVTFRRVDAVKKAMIGGICVVARTADGNCPPTGTPSMVTLMQQELIVHPTASKQIETSPGVSSADATGRVPQSVRQTAEGNPGTFYFHVVGQNTALKGSFCIDNDTNAPGSTTCNDSSDGFKEDNASTQFKTRVAYNTEPIGVIQDVGDRARFGLMVFNCSPCPTFACCPGDPAARGGVKVLTPMGSRQSVNKDDNNVENFNTNKAAMIDSVEEALNMYGTPLGEAVYEAMRYVAQVKQVFLPTIYTYPIAYSTAGSNGVAFGTAGVGGISTGEQTVLTGSETCPAGYITTACGRDPFFYGSNHTPAWASPSAQVACCKTFLLVFTDGYPDYDNAIDANLMDFGHGYHGTHCTGSNTADPPSPIATCSTGTDGNGAGLSYTEIMSQHRDDGGAAAGRHYMDDVAYWGHINDLRAPTLRVVKADGTVLTTLEANGHDLAGKQTVTTYSFYAFGSIDSRGILMNMAKLGAFEDIGCDRTTQATANATGCDVPNGGSEWDKVNNYTGAATPDGLPDAYFESSNADDLQDRLTAAIASILQKGASGTSVSVIAGSSNGEGASYGAYYYTGLVNPTTSNEVKWPGYLAGFFLDAFGNQREDSNSDGKLVLTQDSIIKLRYDTTAKVVKFDRYADANGDGKADSSTPSLADVPSDQVKQLWEAGKQLALKDASTRKILTWTDSDNDGVVDVGEQIAFTTANAATLGPYLRAGAAPFTATAIINFVRGCEISVCAEQSSLRDRRLTVTALQKVWKLGDIMTSTPTVVGPPRERFDILYGDSTYTAFFTQYKTRRQVIYAGANDGMLHAFNAGFYYRGDDTSTGAVVEHGRFTTQRVAPDPVVASTPPLGDELWGFIPYQLLPQLKWLTQTDYSHVYYVDLKPKITDARIFTADADHPNGWGTILIGGMRMGGSCRGAVSPAAATCVSATGAPPMSVTADFGSGVQTRVFYSAYFVLDVTNPEVDPKLLWSFTSESLGLTTSYPTVVRANPAGDAKTSNSNAKWFAILGSGPTGYDASSGQTGKVFAINLATGPGAGNSLVTTFDPNDANSFMGDAVALDTNLDYRTDVTYRGLNLKGTGADPPWVGKMYRLTTASGDVNPANWGWTQKPTSLLTTFSCWPKPCAGITKVGPVATAPAVTVDDGGKFWVFFGSGRYYTAAEKVSTDTQYFYGVKDLVLTGGCTPSSVENCGMTDLVNVSSATVCTVCAGNQVTGVTGVTTLLGTAATTLQGYVQSKDGWYTTLPASRERTLVSPTLIGGTVFFPSFVPVLDVCSGEGDSFLYALFYQTGSAYKESVVGTYDGGGGNTNVSRSISLGAVGMASQVGVHIGAAGSGTDGTTSGTGCAGRVTAVVQSSSGTISQACSRPALSFWSRYISWADQKY